MLKGRGNYVCLQRLKEARTSDVQLGLDGLADKLPAEEIDAIARWAISSPTGDRAELDREPSPNVWRAVSVGPRECPGATKCPSGETCFAEAARQRAAAADVVVVNLHLYGLHLATGNAILPEHDVVIIDECHQLEDIVSATSGVELTSGRVVALARTVGAIVADEALVAGLESAASSLAAALDEHRGRRLRSLPDDLSDALVLLRDRATSAMTTVRGLPDEGSGDVGARKQRAMQAGTAVLEDVEALAARGTDEVAWVEDGPGQPVLRQAPVDVAPVLTEALFGHVTAVLTSATVPAHLGDQLGIPPERLDVVEVGSPFDYATNALLYCAAHLPDPREASFDPAMADELVELMDAAGGRTLALFTSYRSMTATADAVRTRVEWPVLTQQDLPKPALLDKFRAEPELCLFATMSFWQGVDVPGPSLSLVTIDRLPFPRPDEPLLQAKREKARAEAFRTVDLPRAATLLAQGVGRLIRSGDDRGVVAVFDPRLATKASYRWDIVNALPPMRRTRDRAEAEAFLRELRGDASE
jgi:ATP-dependent DNA helicase DinG